MTTEKKPYEIIRSEGFNTLKINGPFDGEMAKLMGEDIPKFTEEPLADLIINCENMGDCTPAGVRVLMQVLREMERVNKKMRFLGVNKLVVETFRAQGVNSAFVVKTAHRDCMVDFGLATKKALDVNFINPFLAATMRVLKVQCQTEAKGSTLVRKDSKEKFFGDISGVIGLVSESFTGSVVITFPEATFLKIMSRMLGENFTTVTKEIEDGAGELTNIIFGQAKIMLNEKGYGIKTAIPSVVMGANHSVTQTSNGPRVAVPFETDAGNFAVEICLSN